MEPRGGLEVVGKFEFSRKDLIGHGAFAVVFKGRHREKHDLEVAVKCINKKNLAKSQTLLGKEIKILKELKHENIVALYDFQEMTNSVYLVMEYCNGGDLADYLHTMRTLSEDTIRLFLQQIAGAMRLLHSKGIIHRDLKPQNILLANPGGRRANPNSIRVKIADFGFARYLQSNMMAATLCGSPMYMAPEVIMSQHYDGKADLWSIGTIVYQCLTGKAPFQASSPQDLRLFYEKNKTLVPVIPRETSAPLRQLLLALLQRNHRDRMDFDDFFHHPFLDASAAVKKSPPVPVPSYPSSGSGSSSSSSPTSHLASPPSLGEAQQLQKTLTSPAEAAGFLHGSRDSGGSSKASSCDTDDFVMVPAQFAGDLAAEVAGAKVPPDSLMCSGSSLVASAGLESRGRTPSPSPPCSSSPSPSPSGRAGPFCSSRCGASVPIPVPTQVHNYQRIEQNLQSPPHYQPSRSSTIRRSGSSSPLGFARASPSPPAHVEHGVAVTRKLSLGGGRPYTPSPQVGAIPEQPGWSEAPALQAADRAGRSPRAGSSAPEYSARTTGLGCRLHSAPNLSDLHVVRPKLPKPPTDPLGVAFNPPQASPPPPTHGLPSCRPLRGSPKLPDFLQRNPLPPILGSPTKAVPAFDFPKTPSSQNLLALLARQGVVVAPPRNRTLPDLSEAAPFQGPQLASGLRPPEDTKGPFGRSLSTGRLTDLLLKAAFGTQAPDSGSTDSLQEKPMEIAPSAGFGGSLYPGARAGASPSPVVFTVGSPPSGTTPPPGPRSRMFSVGSCSSLSSAGSASARHLPPGACSEVPAEGPGHCCTFADPLTANLEGAVTFEAPDLPEETLMEQEHTETLHQLRFTLVFVQHVLEIAALKGSAGEAGGPEQLQESAVADQISLLSREWGFAEQLVLYLKVAELLSVGLHTAIEQIRAGKLCLSSTVKQVVRKLNELYKASVVSCQGLSLRLQRFFLDKQRLLDRIQSVSAEKLIFSHAVQTVQSAALDEMFHRREDCVQRYHKALLLMEGLQRVLSDQADVENIAKCKMCIERRLSALLTGLSA